MTTRPNNVQAEIPPLVQDAIALAERLGFPLIPEGRKPGSPAMPSACIPQVGKLLQVLAAGKPEGLIGELGTGAGVGTAWLASGLTSGARLISAELRSDLAHAVAGFFSGWPSVEIREGDWHATMPPDAPYDLLFVDAASREDLLPANWGALVELVRLGGQIVMDDLTPVELWPVEWQGRVDPKREFGLANAGVVGVEVRTTATTSALVMTRVR